MLLLFALSTQALFGQQTNTNVSSSIPFNLTSYNNLSVKAVLNEKDTVNLMVHTAANTVTLTEDAAKSLRFDGADSVKSWGGSENTSWFSKSNLLQISELMRSNTPIWENKNSGPQTVNTFI
ncbi:hypothetical protein WBJ53_11540 [Spirosoma sp. SC4-14]|uniref:hypothetical protein n=1 Tax=Spirosoma sp. SC4-14 TaxID=3128900 RepID=UPI0030D47F66